MALKLKTVDKDGVTYALVKNGKPVYHHVGVSAFAEYAVVSRASLVKIDASLSFEEAALFGGL